MTHPVSRRFLLFAAVSGAAAGLSACADYYGGAGVGYGYNDYDDLYYDNYYGPVSEGYWDSDGWYYYRDRTTRRYRRDDGRHFRRDAANGYQSSRMRRGRDSNRGSRRNDRPDRDWGRDHD